MKFSTDPFAYFFMCVLMVWAYRSVRALETLRKSPRLEAQSSPPGSGKVSILVPAKNEEANIQACVESLLAQDYPDFELIVINDNSTDRTRDILLSLGAKPADQTLPKAQKLRYVDSPPAPAGWTGKNHALACGVPFASGDWLLFTDADTQHKPQALSASLAFMEKRGLVLLTLVPRCLAHGFWEILVQPVAMAMMGLWFPIEKINNPASRVYFGNGQYLFMHRRAYEAAGGHTAVKGEFLEDFALFKKTKQAALPCAVAVGTDFFGTRMYDTFIRMWRGWRRIYLHAFERQTFPLAARSAGLVLFSVIPFAFLAAAVFCPGFQSREALILAGIAAVITVATSWKAYEVIGASRKYAWLHPLAALILAAILADAARMALTKSQTKWR